MSACWRKRFGNFYKFFAVLLLVFVVRSTIEYYYINASYNPKTVFKTKDNLLSPATFDELKKLIDCRDQTYRPRVLQRSDYWIVFNFIRADHGPLDCHQGVTFATYGDFRVLKHLPAVAKAWKNPISFALYAPGEDFNNTVRAVRFARDCSGTNFVKKYVTFHLFVPVEDFPASRLSPSFILKGRTDCNTMRPFDEKKQTKSPFPLNTAKNIAKEASLTYFNMVSNVELYPNSRLPERFLDMIAGEGLAVNRSRPTVYPMRIFDVDRGKPMPFDRKELAWLVDAGRSRPHPRDVCLDCESWLDVMDDHELLRRTGRFRRDGDVYTWRPVFIGTSDDPQYDERLPWRNRLDHLSQWYLLCHLNYDLVPLNDAFLVTRSESRRPNRAKSMESEENDDLVRDIVMSELMSIYGDTASCY